MSSPSPDLSDLLESALNMISPSNTSDEEEETHYPQRDYSEFMLNQAHRWQLDDSAMVDPATAQNPSHDHSATAIGFDNPVSNFAQLTRNDIENQPSAPQSTNDVNTEGAMPPFESDNPFSIDPAWLNLATAQPDSTAQRSCMCLCGCRWCGDGSADGTNFITSSDRRDIPWLTQGLRTVLDRISYNQEWVAHNRPILAEFAARQVHPPQGERLRVDMAEPAKFLEAAIKMLAYNQGHNLNLNSQTPESSKKKVKKVMPIESFLDVKQWASVYFQRRFGIATDDSIAILLTIIVDNFYDANTRLIDEICYRAIENMQRRQSSSLELVDFSFGFDMHMSQEMPFFVDSNHRIRDMFDSDHPKLTPRLPQQLADRTRSGRRVKQTERALHASQVKKAELIRRASADEANTRRTTTAAAAATTITIPGARSSGNTVPATTTPATATRGRTPPARGRSRPSRSRPSRSRPSRRVSFYLDKDKDKDTAEEERANESSSSMMDVDSDASMNRSAGGPTDVAVRAVSWSGLQALTTTTTATTATTTATTGTSAQPPGPTSLPIPVLTFPSVPATLIVPSTSTAAATAATPVAQDPSSSAASRDTTRGRQRRVASTSTDRVMTRAAAAAAAAEGGIANRTRRDSSVRKRKFEE